MNGKKKAIIGAILGVIGLLASFIATNIDKIKDIIGGLL